MNGKTPKSNRIKKQELQAKKKKPVAPAPKPKIVYFTKKIRNVRQALEDVFAGNEPKYGNKLRGFYDLVVKNTNKDVAYKAYLKRLCLHVADQKVDFIDKAQGRPYEKVPLKALVHLALFHKDALRPVEEWKPPSYNTIRCIADLSRHLYAKYYVPPFMDEVWYFDNGRRDWFVHIGLGNNIRTATGLPVPLTKREAHYFIQAPRDFTPLHAIRYGQIVNMGGNELFVRQILKTRIATDFDVERNKFYYGVFAWLMANPMLDTQHYAPIMDYIHNQKYVPFRMDDNGRMIPPQPNFSMKNRDAIALLRQVEQWHRNVGKENKQQFPYWAASGRKGFYHKSHDIMHTITEICTQKELIEEGREMHHCVASYAGSCARGAMSIWSYEIMDNTGKHKKLTIEVRNSDATITQARGKYNALASASDKFFLNMWATEVGLSISRYMI